MGSQHPVSLCSSECRLTGERLLRLLFALLLAAPVLASWASTAGRADTQTAAPPNILVIVSDDHRLSGTMDSPAMAKTRGWFQTGQVPEFGSVTGGTAYPNGVVSTPLCCPARASIFSGRYGHNNGVTNNDLLSKDPNVFDTSKTLQAYLHGRGYRTGLVGKYLNGWWPKDLPNSPAQWDTWTLGEGQYFPTRVKEGAINTPGQEKTISDRYSTTYYTDKALEFLDQTPSDRPYLLYFAPSTPHSPFTPESAYEKTPVDPFLPLPDSYLERDRRDKPAWVRGTFADEAEVLAKRTAQIRMLYSLDNAIHEIMKRVDLRDQAQGTSTLAFFIGDNGMHWGEHGLDSKGSPYSESAGVPFYMRWPNHVGSNTSSQALASSIDIAPTALEATGTAPSTPMDGRSLITFATRNRQFIEGHGGATVESKRFLSIRTAKFTYIETPEGSFREYYDLTRDRFENSDLLHDDDPENDPPIDDTDATQVDTLHERVQADATCVDAGCPGGPGDALVYPADTKITVGPDPETESASARFVFTSSVPQSTFECALDSATFTSCPSPSRNWPYTVSYTVGSGPHTLKVRASAPNGTADESPAIHQWSVNSRPDTTIGDPKPPKLSNSKSAQFTFTSTSGSSFTCELIGPTSTGAVPCMSSGSQSYSNLSDGDYTFKVNVQGDTTPATYKWQIDTTPPAPSIGQPPAGIELSSGTVISRKGPGGSDAEGTFRCSIDDAPYENCGRVTDHPGLSNGSHTLKVSVTDWAGNTSAPTERSFSVSSVPTYSDSIDPGWPDVSAQGDSDSVQAVIPDGFDGWFVGGRFSKVGGLDHANIAHIKGDSKSVDQSWNVSTDGQVNAMALSTDGKLYIAGNFTTVNGQTHNRIAALSASNGTLVPGWNGGTDGPVKDIALAGTSTAYIVGGFDTVGGSSHRRVAEVNLSDGSPTSWGAALNSDSSISGSLDLRAVAIAPSSVSPPSVFVGGSDTISYGSPAILSKKYLAQLDRTTGAIVDSPQTPQPDAAVEALERSPDAGGLLVGGQFEKVAGLSYEGAFEMRFSGSSPSGWRPLVRIVAGIPRPGGTVYDISASDLTPAGGSSGDLRWSIVMGGNFNDIRAEYTRDKVAEVTRLGSDATADGNPTDWAPSMDASASTALRPIEVYATATSGAVLAVAGKFSAVRFNARRDLVFFRDPPPETTITGHIGGSITASHTQIFTFKSTESPSTFECSLDAADFAPCQGSYYQSYSGLLPGQHTFRVRAKDTRSPDLSPETHIWTVQDFTTTPDTSWPQVANGTEVRAIVPDGNEGWYIGGDFTELCDSRGCGHFHTDVAHIKSDKTVDDSWTPSLDPAVNAGVKALAYSQSRHTLYVGGSFSVANGNANHRRLVGLDTTTAGSGAVVWNPNVTGWVYALELGTDTIYAGGTFAVAGGQSRSRLAELRLDDASVTPWNPKVLPAGPGVPQVWAMALTSSKVYVGGTNIGAVGTQLNTGNLVEIDRQTGSASTWRPNPNGAITAIARRGNGTSIYAAGTFTSIGSQIPAAVRNYAAEISIDPVGTATAWHPNLNSTGFSLGLVDSTVLVGGSFSIAGGDDRIRMAQIYPGDSLATGWRSDLDAAPYVFATQPTVAGRILAVGGVFRNAGGAPRSLLAFYGPPD